MILCTSLGLHVWHWLVNKAWPSCSLPMMKKTFFSPLPLPSSCLTSLVERSNSAWPVYFLLLLPTIESSVILLENVCQYVLLQSFRVLLSGLVITPITLTFSLQLSSISCSQLSPVLCSTLDLFCSKRYLRVRVDWLHYRASFLDL